MQIKTLRESKEKQEEAPPPLTTHNRIPTVSFIVRLQPAVRSILSMRHANLRRIFVDTDPEIYI